MPFPTSPLPTATAAPAWPAAENELTHLADLLTTAAPAIPDLSRRPGDTAGIRLRTTGLPPHARFSVEAGDTTVHAGADAVSAGLHPLPEAGAPCNPNHLPAPLTD
ncbi:hypothetical protein [Streptomyces hydrogenans]